MDANLRSFFWTLFRLQNRVNLGGVRWATLGTGCTTKEKPCTALPGIQGCRSGASRSQICLHPHSDHSILELDPLRILILLKTPISGLAPLQQVSGLRSDALPCGCCEATSSGRRDQSWAKDRRRILEDQLYRYVVMHACSPKACTQHASGTKLGQLKPRALHFSMCKAMTGQDS